MKTAFTILLVAMLAGCVSAQTPIGIKQNSFTTNNDAYCTALVSNIASAIETGSPFYTVTNSGEPQCAGNYYQTYLPLGPGILAYTNGNGANYFMIQVNGAGWGYLADLNAFLTTGEVVPYYANTNGLAGQFQIKEPGYSDYSGALPAPFSILKYTGQQGNINQSELSAAGALTVSNYTAYAETNGAAASFYPSFPPPSNPSLATQAQLSSATNQSASAMQSYANSVSIQTANQVYSNNPSKYISTLNQIMTLFSGSTITASGAGSSAVNLTYGNMSSSPWTGAYGYFSNIGNPYWVSGNYRIGVFATTGHGTPPATNWAIIYQPPASPPIVFPAEPEYHNTNISNLSVPPSSGWVSGSWNSLASDNGASPAPSVVLNNSSTTNYATRLGGSVISILSAGTGVTLSSNLSAAGWNYTVSLTGTNVVYITNLNAVTLSGWGAFTTNPITWSETIAPTNDWTNAAGYFSGIISTSAAAAALQPKGSYLTGTSNLNYSKFTNAPAIPSTNGFVTAAIVAPLASISYVQGLNFLTTNLLSYYAPTSLVISALSGYPTNLSATTNALQSQINTNATNILLRWGTNHAFVAAINVNSNMTASYTTNGSGVITASLGSTTNLYAGGFQPATKNLTNWSAVATNQILLTRNLVTSIVQGNNVLITFTTNSAGVYATVNAYYAYNSPVQFESATITFVNCGASCTSYKVSGASYSHPLPTACTSYKVYNASSPYTDITSSFNSFWAGAITSTASGINATAVTGTPSYIGNILIVGVCQ